MAYIDEFKAALEGRFGFSSTPKKPINTTPPPTPSVTPQKPHDPLVDYRRDTENLTSTGYKPEYKTPLKEIEAAKQEPKPKPAKKTTPKPPVVIEEVEETTPPPPPPPKPTPEPKKQPPKPPEPSEIKEQTIDENGNWVDKIKEYRKGGTTGSKIVDGIFAGYDNSIAYANSLSGNKIVDPKKLDTTIFEFEARAKKDSESEVSAERMGEKKELEEGIKNTKGFEHVKALASDLFDKFIHPQEWSLRKISSTLTPTDAANLMGSPVAGFVAKNVVKAGAKYALAKRVGVGVGVGIPEQGLISGTAAYLQADGTGKSTEEKRQAFIDAYITGAFMGAGGGAVGAAVGHFVEPKLKADATTPATTPTAPKIEPENMIRDMQGMRANALGKTKEQLQESNPLEIRFGEATAPKTPETPKAPEASIETQKSKIDIAKEIEDGAEISLADVRRRDEPAAAPKVEEPTPKAPEAPKAPKAEEPKTKKKVDDDYSDLYAELRDSNLDENQVREIQALLRQTDHKPQDIKTNDLDDPDVKHYILDERNPEPPSKASEYSLYPRSHKTSLAGILGDYGIDGEITARKVPNSELVHTAPAENFNVYINSREKTIELDTLYYDAAETGIPGAKLYQAVYDFAHNNNLEIMGKGLSEINVLRKTENMLASGLRHKSLNHIEIGSEQIGVLFPKLEEHALEKKAYEFSKLDFNSKMIFLDKISKTIIERDFGDAKRFGYDREKRSFTVDGDPVLYEAFLREFDKSASVKQRGYDGISATAYERGIGSSTITRYALSQKKTSPNNETFDSFSPESLSDIPRDVAPFLYQKDAPEISSSVKGMFEAKGEGGVITLMKSSDITTIYHETAHYFERTFTPEEKAHFDAIYGEYAEGRARSEAFAEGFVRWVADGWYGTKEQHGLFAKFARFIRETFRQIPDGAEANFKVTPQMQLFYRAMLGDEKAKAALGKAIEKRDASGTPSKIKPDTPSTLFQADRDAEINSHFKKLADFRLETWHKDSHPLTKNPDGSPRVVYHGTRADFSQFGKDSSTGDWHFFSDQPVVADGYANIAGDGNGNVMPVYLNLKNPLVVDGYGGKWYSLYYKNEEYTASELIAVAKERGHDGLIIKNVVDHSHGYSKNHELESTVFVVKSPEQIKSVNNRGTFDESNPNVLYQSGQEVKPEDTLFTRPTEDMKGFWQKWVDNIYKGATAIVDSKKYDDVKWVRRIRENLLLHANRGELYLDHLTEFRMRLTSGYDKAVDLGKALAKELTPIEREILTRKLEGEIAEADRLRSENPDIDMAKIDNHYAKIRTQIDENAAKLKELGALKDEDNIKDYIKRVYQKQIDEANAVASSIFGGDTSHARGVEKTITVKDAFADDFNVGETLKINGFEYKVLESNQKRGDKVQLKLRRDYVLDERKKMGQVTDASFVVAYTLRRQAEQMEKARLLNTLSKTITKSFDDETAAAKAGYIKLPDDSQIYGALSGQYVSTAVNDDLKFYLSTSQSMGGAHEAYNAWKAVVTKIKIWDTVANPATHFGNIMSNLLMMTLENPMIFRHLLVDKQAYLEAKSYGLFAGTGGLGDMENMRNALKIEGIDTPETIANKFYAGLTNVFKNLLLEENTAVGDFVRSVYANEDNVFKAAYFGYYKAQYMKKGYDAQTAAKYALAETIDRTIDYTKPLPPALRELDRTGAMPFVSFGVRSAPAAVKVALRNPVSYMALLGLGWGLFGQDEKDEAALPVYAKGSHNLLFLPDFFAFDAGENLRGYFNVGRMIPGFRWNPVYAFSSLIDGEPNGGNLFEQLGYLGSVVNILSGKDPRTAYPFLTEEDGPGANVGKRAWMAWREFMPNYMGKTPAQFVEAFGGEKVDKLTGETVTPGSVLLSTLIGKTIVVNMDKAKEDAKAGIKPKIDRRIQSFLDGRLSYDEMTELINADVRKVGALHDKPDVSIQEDYSKERAKKMLENEYERIMKKSEEGKLSESATNSAIETLKEKVSRYKETFSAS